MPVGGSTALLDAVTSGGYDVAAQVVVTLPVVGAVDVTAALNAPSYDESDTSTVPNDLAPTVGMLELGGSVILAGDVVVAGVTWPVTVLFNPNDPTSPIYQQSVSQAPMVLSLGADAAPMVDRPVWVTVCTVDVAGGTVELAFTDVPPGGSNMPAIEATLIEPPWNAGLTSEFVLDRIARTAWNGVYSSWPAQRANCVLAVGLRTSLWPEVGTLLGVLDQPSPTFAPGPYGSGLQSTRAGGGYTVPQYGLSATVAPGGRVFVEFFFSGLTATSLLNGVTLFASLGGSTNTVNVGVTTTTLTVAVGNGTIISQAVAIDAGVHYFAAEVVLPAAGSSGASALVYLDAASYTGTGSAAAPWDAGLLDTCDIGLTNGVYAGLQVTTETSPTPNYPFTPGADFDVSLNPLQAVPAIDKGADAYTELQTVAEAEGGFLAFRDGVLIFRNRLTVATQLPSRTVQSSVDLVGVQSAQTGAFTLYDCIEIDYTEYTWAAAAMVFTPVKVWHVPARSTQVWTRQLPNGVTVGQVDETIGYASADTAVATLGNANSVFRASADPNGLNEMPDPTKLSGTVRAVTPSRIEITVTNDSGQDVWLASPANYTLTPVGTPALWVNGVAVTPDQPTIRRVDTGTRKSVYQVPSNAYRQDPDAAIAYAQWLLALLSTPVVAYGPVDVIADPSIGAADRITLDVPVADGPSIALDVFVWGVSFTASFESGQESWDMSLDVRAVAAPGEWVLDESLLDDTTFIY